MKSLSILLIVLLGLSACSSGASPSLAGTKWTLTSMTQNGTVQKPVGVMDVTLEFGQNGQLNGNSGCNGYGGTYETRGETLKIIELRSTLIACVQGPSTTNPTPAAPQPQMTIMEFEQNYQSALTKAQTVQRNGNQLTIFFDNGSGKLEFVAQ